MNTDLRAPVRRCIARAGVLAPVLVVAAAAPALAETPSRWPDAEPVSPLQALLLLGGVPLLLIAVIALLVYLPSMVRREGYAPGKSWRHESEWFGGPQGGVEAAEKRAITKGDSTKGGASARW